MNEPNMTDRDLLLEMRSDLKEVKIQTIKTNGRVSVLEEWRRTVDLAQAREEGLEEGRKAIAVPVNTALTITFNRAQLVSVIGGVLLVVAAGVWRIIEVGL